MSELSDSILLEKDPRKRAELQRQEFLLGITAAGNEEYVGAPDPSEPVTESQGPEATPFTDAYRAGGNAINTGMGAIGKIEEAVGDAVNPFSPITKPLEQFLIQKTMQGLGIPEALKLWEESSPDSFENAKAGAGWLSLLPATHAWRKSIPRAVNAGTDNLATRLDGSDIHGNNPTGSGGFYGGDPIGGIMAGYSGKEHWRQLWDPQAIANQQRRGFGQHRMDELELNTQNKAPGNARASLNMHVAKNRGEQTGALIETLPMATDNITGTVRAGDTEGLTRLMTSELPEGTTLPPHVEQRLVGDTVEALGQRTGKESYIAQLFQMGRGIPEVERALVQVNDPRAAWSELGMEAAGTGTMGSPIAKGLANKNILSKAEKAFGKPNSEWGSKEWLDYYNSNAVFERGNWNGTQKGHDMLTKQPWYKKLPEQWRERILKLSGMDNPQPGIKEGMPAKATPASAQQRYWTARANPKPPKVQQEYLDLINGKKGSRARLTTGEDGKQYIDYDTSWLSKDQALGGVGGRYSHNITDNEVYASGIDGHDMVGADPVGGDQVWNVTPIMTFKPGDAPKLNKRSQATDPQWQQKMRDFEKQTGVERIKGESDEAYQKRVLMMPADVKLKHRITPLADAYSVGGLFSGYGHSLPEEEPEGMLNLKRFNP